MIRSITFFIKVLLMFAAFLAVYKVYEYRIELNNTTPYNSKPVTMEERERQLTCLAKNIYFEAAQEPFEGKVAVAQVTINRAESGKWPPDICGVVYQKNVIFGKLICQFSWYCETGPKVKSNAAYTESMEVAKKVLLENFRLASIKNAYYYHADYVNPNWNKPKITQIGRHIFYGEKI